VFVCSPARSLGASFEPFAGVALEQESADVQGGLTEDEKRRNVIRFAFAGDAQRFEQFCEEIRTFIPPGTSVVLRGSAVTGRRWKDNAPFDADGPGTSDLDVTLVGEAAVALFKLTGFFVPGVHSRPVSEDDPEIAPDLIPLREKLMAMVQRPVNIQASREIVIQFRGGLLDQPYLTLCEKSGDAE
jgi:hypothetical protein